MTRGEKLYADHVASVPHPKHWKPWANLNAGIKQMWERKAEVNEKSKPKKKVAKKPAAKRGKK